MLKSLWATLSPDIDFKKLGCCQSGNGKWHNRQFNFTKNSYGKNMEGSITIFAEKIFTIKIGGQYLNELEYF